MAAKKKAAPAASNKSLFLALAPNEEAEQHLGVWLDYGELGRIRILRAGGANSQFSKVFAKRWRPFQRLQATGQVDDALMRRMLATVYADTIVLGWEGIIDPMGKAFPYSRENCVRMLTDLPDLFDDIRAQAEEAATFRAEEIEEAAGPLSRGSSSTSEPGAASTDSFSSASGPAETSPKA